MTLLLTGATGVVGGAVLAHLASHHPERRILALVRAPTVAEGHSRIARALERFDAPAAPHLEVLVGDLVDPATYDDPRFDDVTHVLHAAADTSFRSVRNVRRVNILGALTLAHRMRRVPGLQRYLHVGTAFSCGVLTHGTHVDEDASGEGQRHVVEYTRSKAEAETLLVQTAPELPLVIARPSVVVGHTQLGCSASASLFWFYRVADLLRRVAWSLDTREDVVPQDYVAAALVHLLFKPRLAHVRYHISAGNSGSTWHDLANAFARHHGARPDEPYVVTDIETIAAERARLVSRLGEGDEERLLMALRLYFGFPTLTFDNRRLLDEGMPPPPPFADYLDACMTRPQAGSVYEQMKADD